MRSTAAPWREESTSHVTLAEARERIAELLAGVAGGRERVVIEEGGRVVGALVTAEDLRMLLDLAEDLEYLTAAQEALDEMERTGEKPIPYQDVRREFGLG